MTPLSASWLADTEEPVPDHATGGSDDEVPVADAPGPFEPRPSGAYLIGGEARRTISTSSACPRPPRTRRIPRRLR